ncbi:MAG: hypothetical protein KatS3mg060_2307 [Dehalococcoidia bacterium]|nr:MAG: hypothetical protein KatS3mg060_2307 [Dehalococcoidia bacterium]
MSFVAIGVDAAEGPEVLGAYRQNNAYPWAFAVGSRQTLEAYKVTATMAKYAINRDGTIAFRG